MAHVRGPAAGIDAVSAIRNRDALESYYLLYAVRGEFEAQLENHGAAAEHFRAALRLTDVTSERQFLAAKLADCERAAARRPA